MQLVEKRGVSGSPIVDVPILLLSAQFQAAAAAICMGGADAYALRTSACSYCNEAVAYWKPRDGVHLHMRLLRTSEPSSNLR